MSDDIGGDRFTLANFAIDTCFAQASPPLSVDRIPSNDSIGEECQASGLMR
jgi:hypothetical protein